ncbi:MAG TPA: hypothetical protein VFB73_04205, partial [Chloroflexota bacterium]|nr:hypothetical protein [Chloroflexota bacterium]
ATITPAENLLAAISLDETFSLEVVATADARWFLARAGSTAMLHHLADQLGVAYPQAELRPLDVARYPGLDPAWRRRGEQVAACTLVLRAPAYLLLRTFRDPEVAADRAAQADPVLGILAALGDLPAGWRALSQLVLQPAPDNWCQGYLRFAVEHPLARERAAGGADTSLATVFLLAGLLGAGGLLFQAAQWYAASAWLPLGLLVLGSIVGAPSVVWLARRLLRPPVYDPRLVQEKVSRIAFRTQLRLAVFAPREVPALEVEGRLQRVAVAYRQFNLAAGNGLEPRPLRSRDLDLRLLAPLPSRRTVAVLNTRELAGLWHLPQAQADVPLLERTTATRRLPLPFTVARGCRIGVSAHQGRAVPVALPDELLRRHLLLVAKTRRGKSSLLLRLAHYLMEARAEDGRPRTLVLVDPHRDLAEAALGLVPRTRWEDVVYLDVAQRERPFGLNLLDSGLGWDRDKAVANALTIFRHEFDRFWGPRMEDAFRFALLTLYEANVALCAAAPEGRGQQHTLLQVPAVLTYPAFRRSLLGLASDPVIRSWWADYFDKLDHRLQMEIINPVLTKVQRFAGSRTARAIIGQPRSTVDPADWLRRGAIVIVNGAKGVVGEDTAALVGGTLINLMALVVGEQAALPPTQRRPVTIIVDEFHAMPGADYEAILAELAKYGANLVLATQSLARLAMLDRVQQRALQATVFANLDGLFAFQTSAEDARYLCRELGDGLDEQDLVELGDYQCYARLSAQGARLPAFSVRLDAPPRSDPTVRDRLVAASAARYGRAWSAVESDIRSALARVELARQAAGDESESHKRRAGTDREFRKTVQPGERSRSARARNDHREPKTRRSTGQQGQPWPDVAHAAQEGDASAADDAAVAADREEVMA